MAWRSIHTAQFLCVRHRRMIHAPHPPPCANTGTFSICSPGRLPALAAWPTSLAWHAVRKPMFSCIHVQAQRESSSHSLRAQPARQTEEMSASCYKKQISRTTARTLPRPHDLAGGVRFLAASCIYIVGPRAAAEALMSAVSVRQRTTPSRKKLHATPHGWVFNDHGRLWPDGV